MMGAECVVLIMISGKHCVCNTFKGVLYQVGRRQPSLILVPCDEEYDPACGASPSSEDLDFDKWFCERRIIAQLFYFLGTSCRLENGYDIIHVHQPSERRDRAQQAHSRRNTTLRRLFSVDWRGNLIVVKCGSHDWDRAVYITQREVALINILVQR